MGIRLLKIAVVYLFVVALLGGFMGMTQQFTLAPVHAHLLLLGWASLALAGIVYHLYPARVGHATGPHPFLAPQSRHSGVHACAQDVAYRPRIRGPLRRNLRECRNRRARGLRDQCPDERQGSALNQAGSIDMPALSHAPPNNLSLTIPPS
jgi:hypothetical protein